MRKNTLYSMLVASTMLLSSTTSLMCDAYSDSLETVINQLRLDKLQLRDSITVLNTQLVDITTDYDSLDLEYARLSIEHDNLLIEHASLLTEHYELEQERDDLIEDNIFYREENYNLDSTNTDLRNTITLLKIDAFTYKSTIDSLKSLNSKLITDNKQLLKIIEVQDKEAEDIIVKNYELQEQIDSLLNNPALVILVKETISSVGEEIRYNQRTITPINILNDKIEVQLPQDTNNDVWIYDLTGTIHYQRKNFNDDVIFDTSTLPQGLYFITINRNGDQFTTYKFVK